MYPDYSEVAINSHLLQRHGVLSHVAEDRYLYEMRQEYLKLCA